MKEIILGKIIGLLYWLYSRTFRYHVHFEDESAKIGFEKLKSKNVIDENAVIAAVWHQDEIAALGDFAFSNIYIMVSDSKDGTLFSNALHLIGFKTVRGSSTRGGVKAFIGAIKKIREGYSLAIAVDGPKGPIYEVKEGVIKLSEKTGRPILPIRFHPRRFYNFEKAWSKNRLPYPFSVVDIYVGKFDFYNTQNLKEKLLSFDH